MRRFGASRTGITLVEVLMVIAIIAILAGILLPVLTRAKLQSKKTKCASNLHQLGRAFCLYVSDWNGVYPSPGGLSGNYNYWSQSARGGIVSYVGNNGGVGTVWCCPELTNWKGRFAARTYSMNSYLRNSRLPYDEPYNYCVGNRNGVHDLQIEEPRRTILLYEGMHITVDWPEGDDYVYRCGDWSCVRGWFTKELPRQHTVNSWLPWHGEQNNYLYCDGHITSRRPGQRVKALLSTYEEMYEWCVLKKITAARYAKLLEW